MSDTRKRWYRGEAIPVADEIMDAFRAADAVDPRFCLWVGSLRRNRANVGDVEILYVPRQGMLPDPDDLFQTPVERNAADEVLAALIKRGVLAKRLNEAGNTTWGAQNKLAVHVATGMPVDLFAATTANWFNLLVCRTGPASLNAIIATRAQNKGWRWNPYSEGFYQAGSSILRHTVRCEADVFQAVELPPTDPIDRDRLAQRLKEAGHV